MKPWIYICAVVTLLAAILSFFDEMPVLSGIARVVFVIFLIFLIISVIIQYRGGRRTE